jgi:hypothetical protein
VLFAPVGKPKAPGKPMEEAEGLEIFVVSGRNQLGIENLADPNERNGVVASCGLVNQASEVQKLRSLLGSGALRGEAGQSARGDDELQVASFG